ncbi:Homologous to negative regulator of flagellin synthesis FlgM (Anti-sigma-28 factor) [Legionella wadsworthii]|uniref:Negative regulator of flagellin synthesis n=1 Tax=Legionella wadsworthii TaxID=28088 RepID=A0A378LS73_9GAMM|nr:flagellar biosynthesis anti-sigma factor FlgM [Legionella wadsworthii]STY28708.1 Homologous to negative regulator of flagellin synthesis FlgM (Anti-sigma-28 factor) [Legionella wadsworthii]
MSNQISDAVPLETLDTEKHVAKHKEMINHLIEDTLSLSSLNDISEQFESLKDSLKEVSEINEARVLYFKSEIALGTYQIDNDKIASKMLHVEPA